MQPSREILKGWAFILILLLATSSIGTNAMADDAVVLPKGLTRMYVDTHFFIPFDKRFDTNGNAVPYGQPFSVNLNNSVFGALPPGTSLGTTNVQFTRHVKEMQIQPAYGLTDRLTVGINIYYYWYENEINAGINTQGANLGIAPNGQIAPRNIPGVRAATIQDINNLLARNFGLKPIQSWSQSGIGDIEVGGRYQYFRGENFRAAFTGGARFPTGQAEDPDNPMFSRFGNGTYALLAQFQQDWMNQRDGLGKRLGFPEPGDYFINTTFRYEYNLPDTRTLRVCPGGGITCNTKDDVHTKRGDVIEAEVSPKVGLFVPGLILSATYKYGYKFVDHYSGDKGLDYGALNTQLDRTAASEQVAVATLTYSMITLYQAKLIPLPLVAQVSYRNRFAGSGGFGESQYVGLTVQAFF
jgi:hypothetical protein